MNVHCSTVYNNKDLEPTQMPIDDRLDRENVVYIHHGILCSNQKQWVCVLCKDMDEPGNYHSQQTDTRTENQTLHVLTHRLVLNNENIWTQGGEHHILESVVGKWRDSRAWGVGERHLGDKCQIYVMGRRAGNHTATCVPMQQSCMFFTCAPKPKMQ